MYFLPNKFISYICVFVMLQLIKQCDYVSKEGKCAVYWLGSVPPASFSSLNED